MDSMQDDEGAWVPFILARFRQSQWTDGFGIDATKNMRDSAFYTRKGKTIRYDMI